MRKILAAFVMLAGCGTPAVEPSPLGDAERYRGAPRQEQARPPSPPQAFLNLDQALSLAERVHPGLVASKELVEAAEGRALQAGLLPNPLLVARMESAPLKGGTTSEAEYVVGLTQRLPVGGRLGAAREAERLEAERLRREYDVEVFEVRARVRGAFATALFAAEVAKLHTETLELSRRAVVVAKARRDNGDATADEVARVELEEARARLENDKAHGLRELAFVGLAAALGDPALRIGTVEGRLETTLEFPTLESILAALTAGPHEALGRAGVEAASARLDLARTERIPDVALDLFYRRLEQTKTNTFDVGVVIPLPVFDRGQGRVRAAEAERREAEARARLGRGEAVRRVREAYVKLTEAMNRAKLAREEILPRSQTILKVAETRYAAGDLSLAEVLPIRRDHAVARLAYLDGLREVMEAWGDLKAFLR